MQLNRKYGGSTEVIKVYLKVSINSHQNANTIVLVLFFDLTMSKVATDVFFF